MDSDSFIARIMDLLLDAVCVVDADHRFVYVSAACERIFGYTREEMIGKEMITLVHPDDRRRTLEAAADVARGNARMHFENRYVRKDGRVVDIMWSARPLPSEGLRLAVARDVTELKHAARMQEAIYRLSEAAHLTKGLSDLYRQIHHIIGALLPADNFLVALYDAPTETLSFPYFVDEREICPEPRLLHAATPIGEVIRQGIAVLINAGEPREHSTKEWLPIEQSPHWLGVPLMSQEGVVGALALWHHGGKDAYTEKDKELLKFVSNQVSSAIERKQAEVRLFHMAHHDPLTGLPNRMLFDYQVDVAIKLANRHHRHVALLYLDLDDFKAVNDTHGHQTGDQVLCEVAQRLAACVRESDTLGRIGGDEFVVLLADITEVRDVETVITKIREVFRAPLDLESVSLTLSVSIGSALYPLQGVNTAQLARHADAAMYAVKRRG